MKQVKITSLALLLVAYLILYYALTASILFLLITPLHYALCLLIFAAVFTLIKFSLAPIDVWVLLIYVLVSALGVNLANLLISKRLAN
jgi:hypothetical protein